MVAIFAFQAHWTEFFTPLIYLNTDSNFTIPLGLELLNSQYTVEIQQTMAMTLISILPLLIIFFVAQRQFHPGHHDYRRQGLGRAPCPPAAPVKRGRRNGTHRAMVRPRGPRDGRGYRPCGFPWLRRR